MARPRDVPGLDCEEPFARAAARVLAVRAGELFEHALSVGGEDDVEAVHDTRVASRRLRAALELFEPCFPPKRLRKARREVRAMADALGERRDRDVEIEFLERFLEEAEPDDAEEVARLVVRLRVERQRAGEGLALALAPERLEKLRGRLAKLAAQPPAKARKAGLNPKKPFRRNAARIVRSRLEELRKLAGAALEPGDSAAQHEMRIAAKRLRYALEISGPCLSEGAAAARRAAEQLQSVLGELHDCDVLAPKAEGVESLSAFLRTRRELLFARFRELWEAPAKQADLERLL